MPAATPFTLYQDLCDTLPFEGLVPCRQVNDHGVAGHALERATLSTAIADKHLDFVASSKVAEVVPTRFAPSRARMPGVKK